MFKRYWHVLLVMTALAIGAFVVLGSQYDLIDTTEPLTIADATIATVQAAWFQAIGTVLALAIAVGIPIWQRLHSRQDAELHRQNEARMLAYALYSRVAEWEAMFEAIRADVEDNGEDASLPRNDMFAPNPTVQALLPLLSKFDDAGGNFCEALFYVERVGFGVRVLRDMRSNKMTPSDETLQNIIGDCQAGSDACQRTLELFSESISRLEKK